MSEFGKHAADLRPKLRLVVNNSLSPREVASLRLVEHVTRARHVAERLQGPDRAALDADIAEPRKVALRVANRLCTGRLR